MTLTRAEILARFYTHLPGQIRREATLGAPSNTLMFSAHDVRELLAPRRCHAQRNAGKVGLCGVSTIRGSFSAALWEEPPISGEADQAPCFSRVARSDACSVRITRSRKKVLASQPTFSLDDA